jgi:hypothetical protein
MGGRQQAALTESRPELKAAASYRTPKVDSQPYVSSQERNAKRRIAPVEKTILHIDDNIRDRSVVRNVDTPAVNNAAD